MIFALFMVLVTASPIKHVIVLMAENRSFDHFFGWAADLLGVNGLTGKEYNLLDPSNPSSEKIYVDKTAQYLNPCDPNHGTGATTQKIYENTTNNIPTMGGFVGYESKHTDYCGVMKMFTPDRIPVLTQLAQEFAIMDRFFAAHPGPTWPNRQFCLSGTSGGQTETGVWNLGIPGNLFKQKTFFDQISQAGLTWRNYVNDTPWEIFVETIAHNPENIKNMESFWRDARDGTLPAYAWINPRSGINITTGIGSNDQHPDHDVAAGEMFFKDVYEAVRSSPQWNETLLIITMDEHGGFYDHVPPPQKDIPPPDGIPAYPDFGFKFDRLGIRIPTILISPWIEKGTVVGAPPDPQKPAHNSEYDLTSIIATARNLLGMEKLGPLTKRDAWSATFEHVLGRKDPRTDCPLHTVEAPPRTQPTYKEATLPINDLQKKHIEMHASAAGVPYPKHMKTQGEVSEWLQTHFEIHRQNVRQWKESKVYQVGVTALPLVAANHWTLVKNEHWINLRPIWKSDVNGTFCLTYDDSDHTLITAKICMNLDSQQRWVLHQDATLRPFDFPELCLTGGLPENNRTSLQRCADKVQQWWAYHGVAPGDGGGGSLFYGDDGYSLSVFL